MKHAEKLLRDRLQYLEDHGDTLVIDGDTHISPVGKLRKEHPGKIPDTPDYYHGKPISAEDLLAEMKMSGVDMCLTWQNPAVTFYPGDAEGNFESLRDANLYIAQMAEKCPEKFIPAGWTDPKALSFDKAKEIVELCVMEYGFSIVKMNPAQNEFPIDSPEVIRMTEVITALGAVPAFHFGADTPYTPAGGLENIAKHIAPHPVIAVHMGGGGAAYTEAEQLYQDARDAGLRNPNIKYILSAKRDTHMESDLVTYEMAGDPYSSNLCCASDAPYGRQSFNFGGFRAMFETLGNTGLHTDPRVRNQKVVFDETAIQRYMGGNMAALVASSIRSVLARSFG